MEVKSIPESVRSLMEEARASFDQALLLEGAGDLVTAESQAAAAFSLMARAASAASQHSADYKLLTEMLAKHQQGFERTESNTRRTTQVSRTLSGKDEGAIAIITTTVTTTSAIRMRAL